MKLLSVSSSLNSKLWVSEDPNKANNSFSFLMCSWKREGSLAVLGVLVHLTMTSKQLATKILELEKHFLTKSLESKSSAGGGLIQKGPSSKWVPHSIPLLIRVLHRTLQSSTLNTKRMLCLPGGAAQKTTRG